MCQLDEIPTLRHSFILGNLFPQCQSVTCDGPQPQGRPVPGEGPGLAQASHITPFLFASDRGYVTGSWPVGLVLVINPWSLHGYESYSHGIYGQGSWRAA